MTANMELFYWRTNPDWYTREKCSDEFELTDEAPERARKSFALWKEYRSKYL